MPSPNQGGVWVCTVFKFPFPENQCQKGKPKRGKQLVHNKNLGPDYSLSGSSIFKARRDVIKADLNMAAVSREGV